MHGKTVEKSHEKAMEEARNGYNVYIAPNGPRYTGSALVNDLNRIQGLMLGNVLARLLRGFVMSCDVQYLMLHCAAWGIQQDRLAAMWC